VAATAILEKTVFLGTEGGSLVPTAAPVRWGSSAGTSILACRESLGWTAILVRRGSSVEMLILVIRESSG